MDGRCVGYMPEVSQTATNKNGIQIQVFQILT